MSLANHNQAISCTSSQQLTVDDNGGLRSCRFDDIYYNAGQGAEECKHVFLNGNQLEKRWQKGTDNQHFIVAETGFGTGLNFLACWDLWRKTHSNSNANQTPKTLYFYTTERYPLTRAALEKSIAHYNPFPELAESLTKQYPDPIGGEYLLNFDNNSRYPVKLIMLLGDATECLSRLEHYPTTQTHKQAELQSSTLEINTGLKVDAWFLDGYAPSKNPDMWQETLFSLMARHSKNGTTVATFSVARQVRDLLSTNGFDVNKVKGFGRKRDMLTAEFTCQQSVEHTNPAQHSRKNFSLSPCYYRHINNIPQTSKAQLPKQQRQAVIIGAGIAGCTIAYKLAQRGWQISLLDTAKTIASAASGNARAVLYARTAQQRSSLADFHEAAFHYATRFYKDLDDKLPANEKNNGPNKGLSKGLSKGLIGMLKLNEQLSDEMLSLNPEAYSRYNVSAEQASELCGISTAHKGIYYPESGWLDPITVCEALTQHENIRFYANSKVIALNKQSAHWHVECSNNNQSNTLKADIAIITAGQVSHQFEQSAWLPLRSMRGQTTALPASAASSQLGMAVCQRGYMTPASNGKHSIGATYAVKDNNPYVETADHQTNIDNLVAMLSEQSPWRQELQTQSIDPTELEGRVGFRCVAPDYLPIVGPIPAVETFNQQFICLKKDAKQTPSQLATLEEGLYVSTGFGSHGYTTAPLAAEILLAQIEGAPMPIGDKLRQSIAPARFLVRQLIRSH